MTDIFGLRRGASFPFIPRKFFRGERSCSSNMELPMPLKVSVFMGETMLLTAEQRNAYLSLLMAVWLNENPLQDDDAFLARVCGVKTRRFKEKIRPKIEHFFASKEGCWWPCAGHVDDPRQRRLLDKEWGPLRAKILKRDNYTCAYCGRKPPEVEMECDHIIPISRGGSNDPENLTAACAQCNIVKGNRLVEDWIGEVS